MNIPDDKFAAAADAIYNALKELNDGEEMAFILSIRDVEEEGTSVSQGHFATNIDNDKIQDAISHMSKVVKAANNDGDYDHGSTTETKH